MQIRLVYPPWYFISNSIDENVDKLSAEWRKIMGINRVAGQRFFLVTQNIKSNLYRLKRLSLALSLSLSLSLSLCCMARCVVWTCGSAVYLIQWTSMKSVNQLFGSIFFQVQCIHQLLVPPTQHQYSSHVPWHWIVTSKSNTPYGITFSSQNLDLWLS